MAYETLQDRLKAGRFVITAEITPPVSCDAEDFLSKALPLKGLADAVNVTDGAGARAHLGAVTAAALLVQNGIDPVLQFTCRDRNRLAIQGDLMAAAALGIRNLLLLRGDDPTAGDQPETKPVFDLDTAGLMQTARRLRDRGEVPNGRKVAGKAEFFLGAADVPMDPPTGWLPEALKAKIGFGAEFAQTQFCMDSGVIRRYLARLAEHGIPERLSILIGITPPRSARSARWMREKLYGTIIPDTVIARLDGAEDAAAEGRRICLDLLHELADSPGVAGAHIMAPGNEAVIPEVIAAAGDIPRRAMA